MSTGVFLDRAVENLTLPRPIGQMKNPSLDSNTETERDSFMDLLTASVNKELKSENSTEIANNLELSSKALVLDDVQDIESNVKLSQKDDQVEFNTEIVDIDRRSFDQKRSLLGEESNSDLFQDTTLKDTVYLNQGFAFVPQRQHSSHKQNQEIVFSEEKNSATELTFSNELENSEEFLVSIVLPREFNSKSNLVEQGSFVVTSQRVVLSEEKNSDSQMTFSNESTNVEESSATEELPLTIATSDEALEQSMLPKDSEQLVLSEEQHQGLPITFSSKFEDSAESFKEAKLLQESQEKKVFSEDDQQFRSSKEQFERSLTALSNEVKNLQNFSDTEIQQGAHYKMTSLEQNTSNLNISEPISKESDSRITSSEDQYLTSILSDEKLYQSSLLGEKILTPLKTVMPHYSSFENSKDISEFKFQFMHFATVNGNKFLRINLFPEELGNIKVEIKTDHLTKTSEVIVNFSQKEGLELFRENSSTLLSILAKAGYEVSPEKLTMNLNSYSQDNSQHLTQQQYHREPKKLIYHSEEPSEEMRLAPIYTFSSNSLLDLKA